MSTPSERGSLRIYWANQYSVPPDQPGGTRHFDLAAELIRRGHRVELVASDLNLTTRRYSRRRGATDLRPVREVIDEVPFTWLTAGNYRANDWRRVASMVIFGGATFVQLVRRLPRRRAVVIGSSPHLFAALGAWAAARIRRAPFVFEVRDLWPESYTAVSGRERGPEVTLMRVVADLLYRRADHIIVLAEGSADHVASRGVDRSRISYVPNGVDIDRFTDSTTTVDLGRPGCFTFVYAGAHGPANDLATVVRACAELEARGRCDIRVALMGDGPTKATLKELAAELGLANVAFVDPVPKSEVAAALATADAGLMVLAPVELFTYAVSPNKLFDYMAVGLPILTNVAGLCSDIVAKAQVGRTVVGGDPEALATGMEELVDAGVADARAHGHAYLRDHFDRHELALQLEHVLLTMRRR